MLLAAPSGAYSYMHTDTNNKRLHLSAINPWVPGPYLPLAANTSNQSGITPDELERAVVRALRSWQRASFDAFSFDYWQGDDSRVYAVGMKRDGLSSLFFASADPEHGGLTRSQSAYTRVYFDAETGAIDEVDIVLNDVDMKFTADPVQASYAGGDEGHVIVLEDVLAHEFGHALGLGHSGILDATMFAFGWEGQAALSCDDARAVRALYGTGDERSALTGRVLDPEGKAVFGAHVVAVELSGPSVAASTISSRDGGYRIAGLPRGSYVVMVEPFVAGAPALDDAYADLSLTSSCYGRRFSRTFYGRENGRLDVFRLAASSTTSAGDVIVSCFGVAPTTAFDDFAPPVLEFDDSGDLATLLLAPPGAGGQMQVRTKEGPLQLDFVAYSLFSPALVRPRLEGAEPEVATADLANSMSLPEHTGRDARLRSDWVAAGEHTVTLETSLLGPQTYPMGGTYLDEEPFVLVVGHQRAPTSRTECTQRAPLSDYSPPLDGPRRRILDDDGLFGLSCHAVPGSPPARGQGWPVLCAIGALIALCYRAGFGRRRGRTPR